MHRDTSHISIPFKKRKPEQQICTASTMKMATSQQRAITGVGVGVDLRIVVWPAMTTATCDHDRGENESDQNLSQERLSAKSTIASVAYDSTESIAHRQQRTFARMPLSITVFLNSSRASATGPVSHSSALSGDP